MSAGMRVLPRLRATRARNIIEARSTRECTAADGGSGMRGKPGNGGVERIAQTAHDLVDIRGRRDIGRRQQEMVAQAPINGPAHGIDEKATLHCLALDALVEAELGREGRLAVAVADELDRVKEAASAGVADMMVVGEALLKPLRELRTARPYIGEKVVPRDHLLHRERSRAGQRMGDIGEAVLEGAGAFSEGAEDALREQYRADWRVAAAEPLRHHHEVRRDPFLL